MAVDLDGPPLYDPLTKYSKDLMSDLWVSYISTLVQTLSDYLTQYGIIIPNMLTSDRYSIQSPREGQLIYVTDAIPGPPITAQIQVWQVKDGVGAWRVITTTP